MTLCGKPLRAFPQSLEIASRFPHSHSPDYCYTLFKSISERKSLASPHPPPSGSSLDWKTLRFDVTNVRETACSRPASRMVVEACAYAVDAGAIILSNPCTTAVRVCMSPISLRLAAESWSAALRPAPRAPGPARSPSAADPGPPIPARTGSSSSTRCRAPTPACCYGHAPGECPDRASGQPLPPAAGSAGQAPRFRDWHGWQSRLHVRSAYCYRRCPSLAVDSVGLAIASGRLWCTSIGWTLGGAICRPRRALRRSRFRCIRRSAAAASGRLPVRRLCGSCPSRPHAIPPVLR